MTINEKVSYLKGLAEGLNVDDGTKEGKLLKAIVDVLEDIAISVTDLEDGYAELTEYTEIIDEDLEELENEVFGEDEDYEDEDYEDDDSFICPSCGEEIMLEEDDYDKDEIECPVCGQLVELDFDCCCDDEGCSCGEDDKE
jgi:DNA-directed RNA polymerase subunit RPC12/RpoP